MNQSKANSEHCFQFQYCIKIGEGQYASVLIDQNSYILRQAKNICKTHQLDISIADIIEKDIIDEIQKHLNKAKLINRVRPESGKILRNQTEASCQLNQQQLEKVDLNYKPKKGQIKSIQKDKKIGTVSKQKFKYFEEMFRRHTQIQQRKELSRKASQEKISFRPTLNNLSRKIVEMKRSKQNSSSSNFQCVIYQTSKDKTKIAQKSMEKKKIQMSTRKLR